MWIKRKPHVGSGGNSRNLFAFHVKIVVTDCQYNLNKTIKKKKIETQFKLILFETVSSNWKDIINLYAMYKFLKK